MPTGPAETCRTRWSGSPNVSAILPGVVKQGTMRVAPIGTGVIALYQSAALASELQNSRLLPRKSRCPHHESEISDHNFGRCPFRGLAGTSGLSSKSLRLLGNQPLQLRNHLFRPLPARSMLRGLPLVPSHAGACVLHATLAPGIELVNQSRRTSDRFRQRSFRPLLFNLRRGILARRFASAAVHRAASSPPRARELLRELNHVPRRSTSSGVMRLSAATLATSVSKSPSILTAFHDFRHRIPFGIA